MIGNVPTSNDLAPKVVLGMTLEGIFMPHARKQRDDLYAKSKRLVHYTSADIALKIISDKQDCEGYHFQSTGMRSLRPTRELSTGSFFGPSSVTHRSSPPIRRTGW
jgi:hypothetical protein